MKLAAEIANCVGLSAGEQGVELADGAGYQFAHADRAEELELLFVESVEHAGLGVECCFTRESA